MDNVIVSFNNIAEAKCDVIVNASNGVGYMGGSSSVKKRKKGVAENLNYATKGLLEKESLHNARRNKHISSWIYGRKKGDYFITDNCGLKCNKVFHAVTMRFPACRSDLHTVSLLLLKLANWCIVNNYRTIALPYLGCGNGNVSVELVNKEIHKVSDNFKELIFTIFTGEALAINDNDRLIIGESGQGKVRSSINYNDKH